MSRSKRKPIVKDKGMTTHEYWSTIRRIWKQIIKRDPESVLPDEKTIHNDYSYSDDLIRFEKDEKGYKKYSRK